MAVDLQKLYGIPNSATRVGSSNGFDIYYDAAKQEYWELRNSVGGTRPSPADEKKYQQLFPPSTGTGAAAAPAATYDPKDPTVAGKDSSYRYPQDIGATSSDYMIFEFYKYEPPFGSKSGAADVGYAGYNQSINSLAQATVKTTTGDKALNQIILYMPEDVGVQYAADWDGKKFGNVAAGLLATAGKTASGKLGDALKDLSDTAGSGFKRAPAILGQQGVSAIVQSITGESVSNNEIFSSIGGQILNPNTELMFGGHQLRTFDFSYKLVAYNKSEVDIIDNIIRTFKIATLPSFNGAETLSGSIFDEAGESKDSSKSTNLTGNIGFIKNPLLVQPYFMSGGGPHKYLPRLKPCTITNLDIVYTSDGTYATNPSTMPVAIELKVSLMETKLVYADDIVYGF